MPTLRFELQSQWCVVQHAGARTRRRPTTWIRLFSFDLTLVVTNTAVIKWITGICIHISIPRYATRLEIKLILLDQMNIRYLTPSCFHGKRIIIPIVRVITLHYLLIMMTDGVVTDIWCYCFRKWTKITLLNVYAIS